MEGLNLQMSCIPDEGECQTMSTDFLDPRSCDRFERSQYNQWKLPDLLALRYDATGHVISTIGELLYLC